MRLSEKKTPKGIRCQNVIKCDFIIFLNKCVNLFRICMTKQWIHALFWSCLRAQFPSISCTLSTPLARSLFLRPIYLRIWNILAEMSVHLIRQRSSANACSCKTIEIFINLSALRILFELIWTKVKPYMHKHIFP